MTSGVLGLSIFSQLVRASGDAAAAAVKGGDLDGTRYTTLLNLTVLIAGEPFFREKQRADSDNCD